MLKITAETNKTEKIQQRNSMKLKVSSLKRLTKLTNFVRWNKEKRRIKLLKSQVKEHYYYSTKIKKESEIAMNKCRPKIG